MFNQRIFKRSLVTLFLVLGLMAMASAFAAANVVPESGAGDGSGTISGYTVSNIAYDLNAANPGNIDQVSFTLAPTAGAGAPNDVQAQLVAGGSWFTCSLNSGTWECPVAGVTAQAANQLRVVAAE